MTNSKPHITEVEHKYAGVFLITPDKKIIGQHRDDKPEIDNPNQVSSFGGMIEEGEDPHTAAWRELVQEETNLQLKPEEILPFYSDVAWRKLTGEWEARHFYIAHIRDAAIGQLEIYEGQGWTYIDGADDPRLVEVLQPIVAKIIDEIL